MARANNGEVEIEYEAFGPDDDPTLMCVGGLGSQMLVWDEELCAGFVDRGFRVIRMDLRDSGLSTVLADGVEYTLSDMAADVVAVLDAAGVRRAIVMGFSLGGMIAQTMAIEHPERMAALVSISSTTGEPDVGTPTDDAHAALFTPPGATIAEQVELDMAGYRIWSSPRWQDETARRGYFERQHARAWHPGASARQAAAVARSGDRVAGLRSLDLPTLVVHGGRDPLLTPSGGRRTAELVTGAEYLEIDDMGHVLDPQMWAALISAVTALSCRAHWD